MIVSRRKPVVEVLSMLRGIKKIAICGCAECAQACRVGGEAEIAEWKRLLEQKGFQVTATAMPDESCLNFHARKAAKELMKGQPEAILSLACGSGIQTLADLVNVPVYPGSNTAFLGQVERVGKFREMCRHCGDCVLGYTGAICPVSRCAKSLLNGPCGGAKNGRCEVDPENECAWILIYNRLNALGRLDRLDDMPQDRSAEGMRWPQKLDVTGEEYNA